MVNLFDDLQKKLEFYGSPDAERLDDKDRITSIIYLAQEASTAIKHLVEINSMLEGINKELESRLVATGKERDQVNELEKKIEELEYQNLRLLGQKEDMEWTIHNIEYKTQES